MFISWEAMFFIIGFRHHNKSSLFPYLTQNVCVESDVYSILQEYIPSAKDWGLFIHFTFLLKKQMNDYLRDISYLNYVNCVTKKEISHILAEELLPLLIIIFLVVNLTTLSITRLYSVM
jgi:hypothetical protein